MARQLGWRGNKFYCVIDRSERDRMGMPGVLIMTGTQVSMMRLTILTCMMNAHALRRVSKSCHCSILLQACVMRDHAD